MSPTYEVTDEIMVNLRTEVLGRTPIGTDMEDAIRIINNNTRFVIRHIREELGYSISGGFPWDMSVVESEDAIIGTKSIGAGVPRPWDRDNFIDGLWIFWGFDEDSKLIDVYVWKVPDDNIQ